MKCFKCNYVSHDYLDACRKCRADLAVFKQQIGLFVLQPGMIDLGVVLGSRVNEDAFAGHGDGMDGGRTGVEDFDISLDDYSDRPLMRRASGAFIRPAMPDDGRGLQHLTLQLDAPTMSTELPQSLARGPVESPRPTARQEPPPLPPVLPPEGSVGSMPSGHLTLELDSRDLTLNMPSGSFAQPPELATPAPAQSSRTERIVRPDEETTEEELSDSMTLDLEEPRVASGKTGPFAAAAMLAGSALVGTSDSADPSLPRLDATTDDPGMMAAAQTTVVSPPVVAPPVHEPKELETLPLPTLEILNTGAMTIDVDTKPIAPSLRQVSPQRDPSSDSLDLNVPAREMFQDAMTFDSAGPLRGADTTIPGTEEMLPSGVLPPAALDTVGRMSTSLDPNASFELGDTLSELASADFGEEDLDFEFQDLEDVTHDDSGLADDANPFELSDIKTTAEHRDSEPSAQHESMPGHLTLELDAVATSMELTTTTMEEAPPNSLSDMERRSVELRLNPQDLIGTPLADVVFTSLEDTFELDDTTEEVTESGHLTLELDTNIINTAFASETSALPTSQSSQNDDEIVVDLDGESDAPRKA